jgi:ABC-type dipeptide/oligopeptide/nickel transport system permease component
LDVWWYILRRLLLAVFVLLGVMVITFALAHSYGNPIYAWLGKDAALHPNLVKIYEAEYHLNDPLYVQFYYYVAGLAHLNLGVSPSRGFEKVSDVIAQTLPFTLQITFFAVVFTLIIGIALGIVAAFYYKKPVDYGVRAFYLAGYATPSFFAALVLLLVLVLYLHLLPSGGAAATGMATPHAITGIPIVDGLIEGNYAYFWSALQHVLMPSLALAITTFGIVTRILRSSVLDVMQSNFIRTARAKGVDERTVFLKHGLRNAMIPVITVSSLIITFTLTGTVFVENIFGYPGMGQYVYNALLGQDFPGILACTIIYSFIIVLTNLAADILYVVVDPQIRLG